MPISKVMGISDSEGNTMCMEPNSKGAHILIKINMRTWGEAVELLNRWTDDIIETAKQMTRDPIDVWKEEQRRIKMIAEEKRLASQT